MRLLAGTGAIFTSDRKHRFCLWRTWDETKPRIMFIGFNPSTANEYDSDRTINRVKDFANRWGYGSVYMLNLFSFVTAYPEELQDSSMHQKENDKYIQDISINCSEVVFAWGGFKVAKHRVHDLIKMFPHAKTLGHNKDGSPKHPLYIKGNTPLVKFSA